MTDSFLSRYSEILDYHNVNNGQANQGQDVDYENGSFTDEGYQGSSQSGSQYQASA